jgi:transposase
MPWKACPAMEERLRFVARLLDGEGMSDLCREFGISRKTGYKIYNRYKMKGSRPSPIAQGARCATPTSDRSQLSA